MGNSYHQNLLHKYAFLVTGGAGFIGSHLVEYLVRNGAGRIVVLDNLATGKFENISSFVEDGKVTFIEGSIADLATCQSATKGIDYVLHQAALGSVPRSIEFPLNTHHINATGFIHMLEAAKLNKVKRIVFASSSSVYGDSKQLPKKEGDFGNPLSPYAVSKRSNELYADVYARTYAMQIIGLRYFNIFGPRQDPNGPYAAAIPLFIKAIKNQHAPTVNGDGEQTRDFTFVANAVQANIKALFAAETACNRVYNIACGQRISVNALIASLNEVMGESINPIYGPERTGDVRDSCASIELAKNWLDYQPEIDFKQGIKETVNWFLTQTLVNE